MFQSAIHLFFLHSRIEYGWIKQKRRSYSVPTHLVPPNFVSTFCQLTAIYSQSIVNKNNFFTYFYQRKQISRILHQCYKDQTNSFRVIRLEVLGQNVLVLNSCALYNPLADDKLNHLIWFYSSVHYYTHRKLTRFKCSLIIMKVEVLIVHFSL